MTVTMQQVLAEIDREEPDYALLARMGNDALPHLQALLASSEGLKASKAAYAATLIGGAAALPVVRSAAAHHDPQVRIAVASGLGQMPGTVPSDLVLQALGDADVGVRKLALRSATVLGHPDFRQRVDEIARADPADHLRVQAGHVLKALRTKP
jgi:HEAT repeat protein